MFRQQPPGNSFIALGTPNRLTNLSSLSQSTTYTVGTPIYPLDSLLGQYRTIQPNKEEHTQEISTKKQSFLSEILCKLLLKEPEEIKAKQMNSRCECPKNEDGLCELVMRWVDEAYFWKTDPHFQRTYDYYNKKKNEGWEVDQMIKRIQAKLRILGFQLDPAQVLSIAQVLLNYEKHLAYYGGNELQLKDSQLYVWVGLGIAYHIGFGPKHNRPEIIFWALHIMVQKLGDLSTAAMQGHHLSAMKRFNHYFIKWSDFLLERDIRLSQIVWEWLNEMMFGYMGIESIGFFLDCFLKSGWEYLYKVCLSYFEHRINEIRRSQEFLSGSMSRETLLGMILNSREEWPMIFCTASSFNYKGE